MRLYFYEALREYGLELLATSGELEQTRTAHAAYYLMLAEATEFHEQQEVVISSNYRDSITHRRDRIAASTASLSYSTFEELTTREREVLRLLAMGLSNKLIAERLVISPHTVSGHIQSIFGKLAINSRSATHRYNPNWALSRRMWPKTASSSLPQRSVWASIS